MTANREDVIRRFMGEFQEKFQSSPFTDTPIITGAFEAVQQLDRAGARVVSRHEIREKMEAAGHEPANLQDQLDALQRFGAVVPVPRFGSPTDKWYMIDERFVGWLGEVFEHRNPSMPPDEHTKAIAYRLGCGFVDNSDPDPLAAWVHGKLLEKYVVADVESVVVTEIAKKNAGWPADPPDGYLLSEYLQEGWEERFTEHIFHAQINGTIEPQDLNLLEDNVEESFGQLLAAMLYDGKTTFDIDDTRETLLGQIDEADAEAKEADGGNESVIEPMSAEDWKNKTGGELARIESAVDEESIRASAYFGSSDR